MKELPLVSVVTPSLNQAATVAATLESVRAQTYPRIEHIVVDGGSTDGTLEILRKAGGGDALRWTSEPDSGMYDALNKGFAAASGEVLAYLNTDDAWFPWTVESAVAALRDHPEAGFVFGDLLIVAPSGKQRLDLHSPFRLAFLRRHAFLAQPTVFFRREVWEQAGAFDQSLQLLGDCEYWMRIGGRWPGRKINEVLALQRDHAAAKRFAEPDALAAELREIRARYPKPGPVAGAIGLLEAVIWRRVLTLAFLARAATGRAGKGSWPGFLGQPAARASISRLRLAATLLPVVGSRFAPGAVGRRR
ncbi:MAG TPA: glycosyltransferase family 2 protein [Gaiellaceae bacterium]|nr:glycosyltransferase family 2 protein [Gaiellaceae bacterium]